MKHSVVWFLGAALATQLAMAATTEDVGDADSFGHTVTYLGFRQSLPINLNATCDGNDPTIARCVPIVPDDVTRFNESDLGVIRLPARATRTIICHAVTVLYFHQNSNPGPVPATAEFAENAVFTVESPVLSDPALINPLSGQPFNGRLVIGTTNINERHPLAAQSSEDEQVSNTRLCGAGLVSRQQLIQLFGLSPTLATQFFQRPVTIHLGAVGRARQAVGVQFYYLLRLFGDQ